MPDSANPAHASDDELLAASANTPWIGVHVLTEFIFCPRAGIVAFETGVEDTGEELDYVPPLDYLPDFELELIEEALQKEWSELGRWAGGAVVGGILLWVASVWVSPLFLWAILLGGFWTGRKVAVHIANIRQLSKRRDAARRAAAFEPDPELTTLQPVHWWSLLKAGFTPVEYLDPHQEPAWRLSGKPWRVLHKGSLRIPVFRKRWGDPELFPQHFVRMAAYCRLIEQAEGGRSPYGIILFGSGYDGCTVPNTPEHQQAFRESLGKARRLIEAVRDENQRVDTPSNLSICSSCPVGRPREHVPGLTEIQINGQPLPPNRRRGTDRKLYHSPCGDRFDWVPPHELASVKGLR